MIQPVLQAISIAGKGGLRAAIQPYLNFVLVLEQLPPSLHRLQHCVLPTVSPLQREFLLHSTESGPRLRATCNSLRWFLFLSLTFTQGQAIIYYARLLSLD